MKNRILGLINLKIKTYANSRGGLIKNGGAIASIWGIPVCDIYAIVNDDGGAVLVLREGVLKAILSEDLEDQLLKHFYSHPDDNRRFYWNEIDTIYRQGGHNE